MATFFFRPVEGAALTTNGDLTATSLPDRSFSIPDVPTILGDIVVEASATIDDRPLSSREPSLDAPEVREQREWLRYRMTLVRTQTGLKNRMHAILHRHGIIHEYADLFGVKGRRFLNLLVAPNDVTLPESARATLKGYLQLLDHVRAANGNPGRPSDPPHRADACLPSRLSRPRPQRLHRSPDSTRIFPIFPAMLQGRSH